MNGAGFTIIGPIRESETIATGRGVRSSARLRERFGAGRWRKMKGKATVEETDGSVREVEIHWYEAHGVGRRGWKIKCYLD